MPRWWHHFMGDTRDAIPQSCIGRIWTVVESQLGGSILSDHREDEREQLPDWRKTFVGPWVANADHGRLPGSRRICLKPKLPQGTATRSHKLAGCGYGGRSCSNSRSRFCRADCSAAENMRSVR